MCVITYDESNGWIMAIHGESVVALTLIARRFVSYTTGT